MQDYLAFLFLLGERFPALRPFLPEHIHFIHALEISSMGIRVDPEALKRQLKIRKAEGREKLYFHSLLLEGKLPQTMGGGIGQSRLCMLLLQKCHTGEVQAGLWPEGVQLACEKAGVFLFKKNATVEVPLSHFLFILFLSSDFLQLLQVVCHVPE